MWQPEEKAATFPTFNTFYPFKLSHYFAIFRCIYFMPFFFSSLGASEQAEKPPVTYCRLLKVARANGLAKSRLFTHPADTQQHENEFGAMFPATQEMHNPIVTVRIALFCSPPATLENIWVLRLAPLCSPASC